MSGNYTETVLNFLCLIEFFTCLLEFDHILEAVLDYGQIDIVLVWVLP